METTKKVRSIPEALAKAIFEKAAENPEFEDAVNNLTGIILDAAEKVRGSFQDVQFHDAFHPEVHNEIVDGTQSAVKLIVDNWDSLS
jgi:hypothetical protein